MAKPQVQARVEPRQKKRVTDMVDDGEFETQAEAVRHLIDRGLDYEEGELLAPDGGLTAEEVEELLEEEVGGLRGHLADEIAASARREAVRDAGIVTGAIYLGVAVAGVLAGPALIAAALIPLGLLLYPALQARRDRVDRTEPPAEEVEG